MNEIRIAADIGYKEGFQAGAASRDAEIQRLQMALADAEALELGTAEKCDKLRAELAAALAACKAKDEALLTCQPGDCSTGHVIHPSFDERLVESALAIQPDDAALKAWLGEPVAWEFTDAFGTHYTDDQRDWMDTPGIESVTPLYSPKDLK